MNRITNNDTHTVTRGAFINRTRFTFRELCSNESVAQTLSDAVDALRSEGYTVPQAEDTDLTTHLVMIIIKIVGSRTYSERWIVGQTRQLARRIRERGCRSQLELRGHVTNAYGIGAYSGVGTGNVKARTRSVLD